MREILFRGKRTRNGEWVYGYMSIPLTSCAYDPDAIVIVRVEPNSLEEYDVSPETIGQYTGLTDKNGKKIFEGDVIKYGTRHGSVIYEEGLYTITDFWEPTYDSPGDAFSEGTQHFEVVGNIHDKEEE